MSGRNIEVRELGKRERKTERQRQTDRQRQREAETETETDREVYTYAVKCVSKVHQRSLVSMTGNLPVNSVLQLPSFLCIIRISRHEMQLVSQSSLVRESSHACMKGVVCFLQFIVCLWISLRCPHRFLHHFRD